MLSKEVFSRNLRNLMNRDKMNQVQLAETLGVTKAAVNYWYNGRSIPQVTVLQRMAKIFCCTTDDLLKDNNEEFYFGSSEDRLLSIYRSLSDEGQAYLLQQAHIASQMFSKKDSPSANEQIV